MHETLLLWRRSLQASINRFASKSSLIAPSKRLHSSSKLDEPVARGQCGSVLKVVAGTGVNLTHDLYPAACSVPHHPHFFFIAAKR